MQILNEHSLKQYSKLLLIICCYKLQTINIQGSGATVHVKCTVFSAKIYGGIKWNIYFYYSNHGGTL